MIPRKATVLRVAVGAVVILAVMASMIAATVLFEHRLAHRVDEGIRVDASVTAVSTPNVGINSGHRVTRVEISYVVDGTRYTGPLMWVDGSNHRLKRFHTGDTIPVYVDPSNPRVYATDEEGYAGSEGWLIEIAQLAPGLLIFALVVVIGFRVSEAQYKRRRAGRLG